MRPWEIAMIAESAYKHGQGYRDSNIYRNATKLHFKKPSWTGLPNYVIQLDFETHVWIEKVYIHAFRAGLNSLNKEKNI